MADINSVYSFQAAIGALSGLQGEYISFTHSNAMEAFIIEQVRPSIYLIALDQIEQNAGKQGKDQL